MRKFPEVKAETYRADNELDLVPGIRVGTSFRAASAADWAAEKRASRIASCWWIRSPLPPHPT